MKWKKIWNWFINWLLDIFNYIFILKFYIYKKMSKENNRSQDYWIFVFNPDDHEHLEIELNWDDHLMHEEIRINQEKRHKELIEKNEKLEIIKTVWNNPEYKEIKWIDELNWNILWDKDIIQLKINWKFKDKLNEEKQENRIITIYFYIKRRYPSKLDWFIILIDAPENTKNQILPKSYSKMHKVNFWLPLIIWWRRKIAIEVNDPLFISLWWYLHEQRINEINIFQHNDNQSDKTITHIIRNNIFNIVWRKK